jgi:hypothetical protein
MHVGQMEVTPRMKATFFRPMKQKPLPPHKIRMTAKAYREAIQKMGLSQVRVGEFCAWRR